MIAYGWAIEFDAPAAIPLLLQFTQGFWGTFFYTTYATLLVDGFPDCAGTAAATTSITRCAMASVAIAVLEPLVQAAGHGWFFTALGLWSGLSCAATIATLRWKGAAWRIRRSTGV